MRQGALGHPAGRAAVRRRAARASSSAAASTTTTSRSWASRSTCAPSAGKQLLRGAGARSPTSSPRTSPPACSTRHGLRATRSCRRSARHHLRVQLRVRPRRARTPPFKTWGPIVQAVSGLTFSSGLPGEPPAGWGYSYMDHMGAQLHGHRHPGRRSSTATAPARASGSTWRAPRPGPRSTVPTCSTTRSTAGRCADPGMPDSNRSHVPAMAPHGIYPPRAGDDSWVAIACRDDDDWRALADGDRRAVGDRRPLRHAGRAAGGTRTSSTSASPRGRATRDRFATRGRRSGAAGVPAAAVARPEDRIDHDPGHREWGLWPTVAPPRDGRRARRRHPGAPVGDRLVDRAGRPVPRRAQRRGAVGELLGLDDAEIDAARPRTASS